MGLEESKATFANIETAVLWVLRDYGGLLEGKPPSASSDASEAIAFSLLLSRLQPRVRALLCDLYETLRQVATVEVPIVIPLDHDWNAPDGEHEMDALPGVQVGFKMAIGHPAHHTGRVMAVNGNKVTVLIERVR